MPRYSKLDLLSFMIQSLDISYKYSDEISPWNSTEISFELYPTSESKESYN